MGLVINCLHNAQSSYLQHVDDEYFIAIIMLLCAFLKPMKEQNEKNVNYSFYHFFNSICN